jgi:murein DD-endopeptidase MepM/ murein hydrolase activator NlpD
MEIKKGFDLFTSKTAKRVKYRFVVLRDDSFKEVASFKLTIRNLLIAGSTVFVSLVFCTAILIIYTPLKYYIPGYQGDFGYKRQLRSMLAETDSLENTIKENNLKLANLSSVMTGKFDSTYSKKSKPTLVKTDSIRLDIIGEDDLQLRKEMAAQRSTSLFYGGSKTASNDESAIYKLYFFPPIKGFITSNFEPKKEHFGVDVVAPEQAPIKACLDGTVISTNWTLQGGYELAIQHNNNLISFYRHNSKLLKKVGNFVKAGEVISIIGNSGELTSGPHLHFELWKNGVAVNPVDFIKFN